MDVTSYILAKKYIDELLKNQGSGPIAQEYIDNKIAELVNSAPEMLDTIGELAKAFQDNEEVIDALNKVVSNKVDKEDGKVLSSNDFTDELLEKVNNIENLSAKDWDQNDENHPEYIKNKPFGETGEFVETEIFNGLLINSFGALYDLAPLKENNTYKVIIGNQEFITQATFNSSNILCLGNINTLYNPIPETSEYPFCCADFGTGYTINIRQDLINAEGTTFIISQIEPKINPLPKKYIKDYLVGEKANIQDFEYENNIYNSKFGAEIFNDNSNVAIGTNSHAQGFNTVALGDNSHAEGMRTEAIGNMSHAEGFGTEALREASHSEGYFTEASGLNSHAEGLYTVANTNSLHVEGRYNISEENPKLFINTFYNSSTSDKYDGEKIIYIYSEEPVLNQTTGLYTCGNSTKSTIKDLKVKDYFSFEDATNSTIKEFLYAKEFIGTEENPETNNTLYVWNITYRQGTLSTDPGKYLHIVGNGTHENRSNAHTLEKNGTAWFQGDVYTGSTSGVNMDEGSKKLATEDYVRTYANEVKNTLLNGAGDAYDTLKELGELIDENQGAIEALEIIAASKSDWNQNDETALDYIKNRPFYETGEFNDIAIIEDFSPDLLNPSTCFDGNLPSSFIAGETYKIILDGIEYLCEAKKIGQFEFLGNPAGYFDNFLDVFLGNAENVDWGEQEPFCLYNGTLTFDKSKVKDLKISIYKRIFVVKSLDRKYIDYIPGENVTFKKVNIDDVEYICGEGSEIFNDYVNNIAIGEYSHAEGFQTKTEGAYAHAEGFQTKAEGAYAHAEGGNSYAKGLSSHAEGLDTISSGYGSHAEGRNTESFGLISHAEGQQTIANGEYSHVQGKYNLEDDSAPRFTQGTIASGEWPEYDGEKIVYLLKQEPIFNNKTGLFTIAIDEIEEISFKNLQKNNLFLFTYPETDIIKSFYVANDFISTREDEESGIVFYKNTYHMAIGSENEGGQGAKLAHIVGNGANEENRSNAHTLDWEGNAWFQGDVYVGSTSGVNRDEGSKKLLTSDDLVQSDWNQNDETTLDYVKNRPFYEGEIETNYNLPEMTIDNDKDLSSGFVMLEGTLSMEENAFYEVIFNGDVYTVKCIKEGGAFKLGDESFQEYPFYFLDREIICSIRFAPQESPITIAVRNNFRKVKKLERKFVDKIAGMDVEGNSFVYKDKEYIAEKGAEIFNDYNTNIALGGYSHAEGYYTTAFGYFSHAEGSSTKANGQQSHAEGLATITNGVGSHAEGWYTIASGDEQHVQGKCNIEDTEDKYAHITGNGKGDDNRSNAHTLDWEGNAWFAGDIYIKSTSGTNRDEGSKKLATEEYINIRVPAWTAEDEGKVLKIVNGTPTWV